MRHAALLLTLCLVWPGVGIAAPDPDPAIYVVSKCVERYLDLLKPQSPTIDIVEKYRGVCSAMIQDQNQADTAATTTATFKAHRANTDVLMWMVVVITLAGVSMAAVQLYWSYRLAQTGHGNILEGSEATLSKDKVVVKSSVVGIIVLAFSLAFFIVYVKYVYTLTPTEVSSAGPGQIPIGVADTPH